MSGGVIVGLHAEKEGEIVACEGVIKREESGLQGEVLFPIIAPLFMQQPWYKRFKT